MSTKRALLIGANYSGANQLYGCIFDIIQMKSVLLDVYGFQPSEIITLRDDDPSHMPTKARILQELVALVQSKVQTVFIQYSGHGTNITDMNKDEKDGVDECIVPCDYAKFGIISDDELNAALKGLVSTGLAVFDCCRSGTILDLPYETVNATSTAVTKGGLYCFAGCLDNQLASETFADVPGLPQGAMTDAFITVLRKLKFFPTMSVLFDNLKQELKGNGFDQIPQLTSNIEVTHATPFPYDQVQPIPQNDIFTAQIMALNMQIAALTAQNSALTTPNSALTAQNSALIAQITKFNTQVSTLNTQVATLTTQVATLTTHNSAFTTQVATLTTQNSALNTQVATLTTQNSALNKQVAQLTSQNSAFIKQVAPLTAQNSAFIKQVATLTAQNSAFIKQVATLTTQNSAFIKQVATLTTQNYALNTQVATLTAQNSALNKQVATLTIPNSALNTQVLILTTQIATLTTQKSALITQVATLIAQNSTFVTQINTLKSKVIKK
jgi:regulator of replication initiation timing